MRLNIQFVEVPFLRALRMMKFGRADIMLGPNRTPEREQYMVYNSEPLHAENKTFYIRVGEPDITAYADLAGKTVCCVNGHVYFPEFDRDSTLKKELSPSYESSFNKLSKGRCDALITPEGLGRLEARNFAGRVRQTSYVAKGKLSYITISTHSRLAARMTDLDHALQDMVVDGTFERIAARYGYAASCQDELPDSKHSALRKKSE